MKKILFTLTFLSLVFLSIGSLQTQAKPPLGENEPDPFEGIRIEDYVNGLDQDEYDASWIALKKYCVNFKLSDAPSNVEVVSNLTDDMMQLGSTNYYLVPNLDFELIDNYYDTSIPSLKVGYELDEHYFGTSTTYLDEQYNFVLNDLFYVFYGTYHKVYEIHDWVETYEIVKYDPYSGSYFSGYSYSSRAFDGTYSSGWPLEAASGSVARYLEMMDYAYE